ncbi:MAG: hypothetical protein IJJ99_04935 [Oscillospiraceae bacterium]|nr:hypothetical protein [Oscillospiraceae bacterium]
MSEFEFGKLEDDLLRLCKADQPDYDQIRKVIADGANVNAVNRDGRNLLSAEFWNCCASGEKFPQITKLLLDNGFDAERFGLACISQLIFSTYDEGIFYAAKLLLEAGAKGTKEQWDRLLESIGTEESYQRCCDGNHRCKNIYYALYKIVDGARKSIPYSDIDLWTSILGKKINSVFVCSEESKPVQIQKGRRYEIPDSILFEAEDRTLIIEANPNIYTRANPVPALEMEKRVSVEGLRSVIGATVTRITFRHAEVKDGTTGYRQPNIYISFSNGISIRFSTNFGEVPKEDTATYFEIGGSGADITATEWINDWLGEFPEDKGLVDRCRNCGETDEQIKAFLEGI